MYLQQRNIPDPASDLSGLRSLLEVQWMNAKEIDLRHLQSQSPFVQQFHNPIYAAIKTDQDATVHRIHSRAPRYWTHASILPHLIGPKD